MGQETAPRGTVTCSRNAVTFDSATASRTRGPKDAKVEGWLVKQGELLGMLTEKRRYFVLDAHRKLLLYYADESKKQQLGVIDLFPVLRLEESLGIADAGDDRCAFSIICAHRVYELRARSVSEASLWVSAIDACITTAPLLPAKHVTLGTDERRPNESRFSTAPWAVESVWIDGDWQDAPLRIMAPLCLKSTDARIFLKLADGTTYSIDASMLSDGAEHEVATAGDGALLARLTHMQPPMQPPTQPPTQPPPTQPPTPTPTHARADARTDVHARKPAPASPHASTTAAVRAGPKGCEAAVPPASPIAAPALLTHQRPAALVLSAAVGGALGSVLTLASAALAPTMVATACTVAAIVAAMMLLSAERARSQMHAREVAQAAETSHAAAPRSATKASSTSNASNTSSASATPGSLGSAGRSGGGAADGEARVETAVLTLHAVQWISPELVGSVRPSAAFNRMRTSSAGNLRNSVMAYDGGDRRRGREGRDDSSRTSASDTDDEAEEVKRKEAMPCKLVASTIAASTPDTAGVEVPTATPSPASLKSAARVSARSAAKEVVNFSGKFQLNLERSDDQTELLKAIGVPWVARIAMTSTSRTVCIEHDGIEWTETIITPVLTKTRSMLLDGQTYFEASPVDKTQLAVTSQIEENGRCVASRTQFADGVRTQSVRRYITDGGKTYLVVNTLTCGQGPPIITKSYFDKKS